MGRVFKLACLGANAHFGQVVVHHLLEKRPSLEFVFLGRRPPKRMRRCDRFISYDFEKDTQLPELPNHITLLVDFTGPVKPHDGLVLAHCLQASIGYMDLALHNSHLENCERLLAHTTPGFALVHTGIFPGFSNLMAKRALELATPKDRVVLVSSFPCYNGGGRHVAQSLYDMLSEAKDQILVRKGRNVGFTMAQQKERFPFFGQIQSFLAWELPEIRSLNRWKHPHSLERWVRIIPGFINPLFALNVKLFQLGFFGTWRGRLFKWLVYQIKHKLLHGVDAAFAMEARVMRPHLPDLTIGLRTNNGLTLHGVIVANFIYKTLCLKSLPKGLFTPEQLFDIEDILPTGLYETYELNLEETGNEEDSSQNAASQENASG